MEEFRAVVAAPFRVRGRPRLTPEEFLLALSLELKWYPRPQAESILQEARASGLLTPRGETLEPTYPVEDTPPPASPPVWGGAPFERILTRLMARLGVPRGEAIARTNRKQQALDGLVDLEVAGLLAAREASIPVGDLVDEVWASIYGKMAQKERP
ncbi:MAG: DUF2240 family protein [Euryarchaeota archaeon]|nr:DUF2240 family protein [Euryarchaeota archaeon]